MGNPHYWLNPYNGRIMAGTIYNRLIELYPDKKEIFQANLKQFKHELDIKMFGNELVNRFGAETLWNLHENNKLEEYLKQKALESISGGWYKKMLPHKGKAMITYHKSWNYFVHCFGLKIPVEFEPIPGIPPSPSHLEDVINLAKNQKIRLIVVEPFYGRKSADKVAESIGGKALVLANSVEGSKDAVDYISLIDIIVNEIADNI